MDSGTGRPRDVAQVRLFDPQGTELTLHTGLIDDEMLLVEVRLYAPDGRQLGAIAGGVDFALSFAPASLATSAPVSGQPLQRIVTPTASSGAAGSETVSLHFPGDGSTKSFGPFHVQVQPSAHGRRFENEVGHLRVTVVATRTFGQLPNGSRVICGAPPCRKVG